MITSIMGIRKGKKSHTLNGQKEPWRFWLAAARSLLAATALWTQNPLLGGGAAAVSSLVCFRSSRSKGGMTCMVSVPHYLPALHQETTLAIQLVPKYTMKMVLNSHFFEQNL